MRSLLINLDKVVLKYYFFFFYKSLRVYDIVKPKDSKLYFQSKFIICQLNMRLNKVCLCYLRPNSLCLILIFVTKMGFFS